MGFPGGSDNKESACNAGDLGLILGLKRPPGGGHGIIKIQDEPWGFPSASEVKNLPANAGDAGLIPGSGRSPGEGNGNSLQYS